MGPCATLDTQPGGNPLMGRTEYYYDPHAPKANSLIPASNLLVVDERSAILLQRRRDTGQWALPGGAQDIGETAAQCAVRECLEETGILADITGFSVCTPTQGTSSPTATARSASSTRPPTLAAPPAVSPPSTRKRMPCVS